MRISTFGLVMASALVLATTANAQEAAPAPAAAAPAIAAGAMLKSSDGKRIGRIDRIVRSRDGTPVSASIIYDSRFIYVPVSTISASPDGLVTSLTRSDALKLK
jgi:hypothetical protein